MYYGKYNIPIEHMGEKISQTTSNNASTLLLANIYAFNMGSFFCISMTSWVVFSPTHLTKYANRQKWIISPRFEVDLDDISNQWTSSQLITAASFKSLLGSVVGGRHQI